MTLEMPENDIKSVRDYCLQRSHAVILSKKVIL